MLNEKQKKIVAVTSPPYDNRLADNDNRKFMDKEQEHKRPNTSYVAVTSPPYDTTAVVSRLQPVSSNKDKTFSEIQNKEMNQYNTQNSENIGNQKNETYKQAMLQVYREAAKCIPVIVTVTKNPTRNKQLRRLDIDTANMLMIAGYKIIDYHRAMLFEEHKQQTLTGHVKHENKGRISFFKRLSLEKGNIAARWEDIIIAAKNN